ncbi:ClpXP protease specificity-enhancing factor [Wenzhouxiangella limi]|uniref:ClpXP protease specificity-enhancing factor n=1 Tax=Wenzhouxiangella limi TaxID=2707351 RepID=A0A845UY02_9GAMM|nr:ClpXP protease specificity-enhancing factor [Wenzhouxiangella limi]NDY95384.1 ClpXP protease specificity-enhancing factor [Wenzhouxiangella limi]
MLSSRPYLLRAVHEWIVDSGLTPHLIADAEHPELDVPNSARQDGRVVLNVSPSAVRDLLIDGELVTFVARFGGVSRAVTVPMAAVQAIYARENGRGMMFPDEEEGEASEADQEEAPIDEEEARKRRPGPNLRVVK